MAVAAVSTASSVDSAAVALTCGELGAVEGCCRELSSHCRTLDSGDLPRTSVRSMYIYIDIDITMYIMYIYIYNYLHIYYMFFFIYGIRVLVRRQRRKKKKKVSVLYIRMITIIITTIIVIIIVISIVQKYHDLSGNLHGSIDNYTNIK